MFVDPAMLKDGATHSHGAADHARAGAESLDQNAVTAGIFGSFGAADVYHQAISTRHSDHVTTLNDHRRVLTDVANKAHRAREAFIGMDQHSAAELRAVRCNSGI
ncbi:DUF2563 family protein [Mycolicibacter longobardus]|uniref:DUF2563 domain-containing protein n=1 Tax=Mycolicibacter longobardus TaxID=1108812 RepID=A0A1X1YJA2_9MYCO|nr:DUF2563 family protein [Mycolicibacter longobardus]MCV7385562.1 DUF2563 family protein [Mycolicibacter longobardus]ORW11172.1 hypothetical protein AWC16_11355 [Mycolicibacter longobardus]